MMDPVLFEFYKEGNRIAGAGHHGLVAGSAPDQHVVCHRDILSEFKHEQVFALARKRVICSLLRRRVVGALDEVISIGFLIYA